MSLQNTDKNYIIDYYHFNALEELSQWNEYIDQKFKYRF